MATFGVKLAEFSPEAIRFFNETNERLKDDNLVKNPFKGKITKFKDIYIVYIEPIYIHFTPVVWGIAAATFLIWGWGWYHFGFIAIGCLGIFWSKYFFYFMLKKGLRKAGYNGSIQLLKNEYIIKEVATDGTN